MISLRIYISHCTLILFRILYIITDILLFSLNSNDFMHTLNVISNIANHVGLMHTMLIKYNANLYYAIVNPWVCVNSLTYITNTMTISLVKYKKKPF